MARIALVGKAVSDTADAVANAALAIVHCQVQPGSDEDKRARVQLELSIRCGGMGLHRLSPAEGSAAFLSSVALTNVAMTGAPEQFRPSDGPALRRPPPGVVPAPCLCRALRPPRGGG